MFVHDWISDKVRFDGTTRTSSIPELLVAVRRDDSASIHRQLERGLQEAIRSGRLRPGTALPSTRALAAELDLSRGVVVEAYEQLTAEGYLESRPGGKTRVARRARGPRVAADASTGSPELGAAPAEPTAAAGSGATAQAGLDASDAILDQPSGARARFDFAFTRPDVTQFPRQVWLRSLRRVLNEAPSERFTYLDGRGVPELREALASYVNRVRGTAARADRIVVTNGFAQGLRLVLEVVRAGYARSDGQTWSGGPASTPARRARRLRVAIEDPGQNVTRVAAPALGLEVVPIPVDDDGIDVGRLARVDAALCLVTPAHEFPTGAVLSAERRAGLLRWARERDAILLEDDYDAEFRYDREPVGALQGLAPEQVIYAGSASKTLAPGLRLGWLALPERLVEPVTLAKVAMDRGSPSLEQLAFADFLDHGEFDRHLRRMRPLYRSRRDALLRALSRHLPELRPVGASAGLHVLVWLPDGVDEATVISRAAELDVAVDGLAPYRTPGYAGPGGLLLGYAQLSEREIEQGIERLARAVRGVERPRGSAAAAKPERSGRL